ncbi:MAG TPA: DUF4159 domain-containing protein [Candidatus Ozemobacteraceae bacterium]|nr:DUF4159 domain-containing protein [Candidatus Ozemobacteraceae bacterium]HQG28461.1 DUF4159 domain-containing protein [Candidatus Ozemobacteraceae bacterium]
MHASTKRLASLTILSAFLFLLCGAAPAAEWGTIAIPRIQYGGGGDWYTDPTSLPNLLKAAADRFNLSTRPDNFAIRVSDQSLFAYPMIYITGHGNVKFEDHEVNRLVTYLDNGGFLWVDDCYGIDRSIRREFRKLYPDKELALLPADHPIYRSAYDLPKGLPKIHEHDGKPPQGYGIFSKGRLVIFYTYETDIGDGLEDEGVHPENTPEKREEAMKMALNILFYALSQ